MSNLTEGRLNFEFDTAVQAAQYDKWTYYRKHFSKISGMKAVDFVCYKAMEDTCWLIEVKDYRASTRTKPSRLKPRVTGLATLRQKLKSMLKAIDPRVLVVSMAEPAQAAPWIVTDAK